jgi:hypothetical protein
MLAPASEGGFAMTWKRFDGLRRMRPVLSYLSPTMSQPDCEEKT